MRNDADIRVALGARSTTDPATLQRVIAALLAQLGGSLPAVPTHESPIRTGDFLERRTVTPLQHMSGSRP